MNPYHYPALSESDNKPLIERILDVGLMSGADANTKWIAGITLLADVLLRRMSSRRLGRWPELLPSFVRPSMASKRFSAMGITRCHCNELPEHSSAKGTRCPREGYGALC